jgi:hypothetical protein
MQSVLNTTKTVTSSALPGEVYLIHLYVIIIWLYIVFATGYLMNVTPRQHHSKLDIYYIIIKVCFPMFLLRGYLMNVTPRQHHSKLDIYYIIIKVCQ